MKTITMMGIDPSISNTGYAIARVNLETRTIEQVLKVGLIESKAGQEGKKVRKSSEDMTRARAIAKSLRAEIAEHDVKVACAEVPSGAQSARAALSNGVCIGLLASLSTPLFEVNPTEVKLASAGNKTADKEDIVRWAVEKFGNELDWPTGRANDWDLQYRGKHVGLKAEHPADACAAIAAGLRTPDFERLAGMILSLA